MVCSSVSRDIGSISWAISLGLLDKKSLQDMPCSPQSKIAAKSLFHKPPEVSEGVEFKSGDQLELFHNSTKEFRPATVTAVLDTILKIKLNTDEEEGSDAKETEKNEEAEAESTGVLLLNKYSLDIFPVGWCASNNVNLKAPPSLAKYICEDEVVVAGESTDRDDSAAEESSQPHTPAAGADAIPESFNSLAAFISDAALANVTASAAAATAPAAKPAPLSGFWCPRIYFNHLCYSASFLRRPRLEALPRYIGPGPVRLVIREVISKLIASSFKSGAVLKKLEVGERRRPNYWLETMKVIFKYVFLLEP